MLVIGLYCFATLLFFLNKEPFTTAGVFLSVCYLPGLSLFSLFKQEKISFEDLILAFPCSIGLSSIFIIGLLFLGIHISHIPIIILAINGLAVSLIIVAGKKNILSTAITVNRRELLFSLFALFLTLLISIPLYLGPNRIGIAAHAFHHSLLVAQIMNGIFPPENPGLGGTIIGYYWGFHALIAALTAKTNFQQIQIMFILNAVSLYVIFCISYCFAKAFDLSELYRYILPLAIIGLMRADAGVLFLIKLFSGNLMSLKELTASPVEPYEILSHWISGLSWVDTRLFFLHKLYNVSGMLLSLSLCYAYLLILPKKNFYKNKIDMISIALIISACFLNYPPLAIFILFHAPLWSFYIFLSCHGNLKEKIIQASKISIPYIIAGLIVSPYMLYVVASRNISSAGQGEIIGFDFYDQSLKNLVVFMAPFPIIVYGFWAAMKKLSFSKELYFLIIGILLSLIFIVVTRWPFDNSYKFNYILVLFFALLFLSAFASIFTLISSKWLKRFIAAAIIIFLSITPIVVESSHIVSSFSTDYIYSFAEKHIIFVQDKQKNEAYTWIRENTPHDALIMLTYTETNWPCCGFNNNYISAAVAERTLYVIKDEDYTVSNPEFAKRVFYREKLFKSPEDQAVIDFFSALNRPVYLLVEKDAPENYKIDVRFEHFPENPGKPFKLVFQNERQRVYQIQFSR